jgi:Histidine phosphatase superfamily (branch 1)
LSASPSLCASCLMHAQECIRCRSLLLSRACEHWVSAMPPSGSAGEAWRVACNEAAAGSGRTVVVVAHAAVLSALVCYALGLGPESLGRFRFDTGCVSLLEFPDGVPTGGGSEGSSSSSGAAIVRTLNYSSHLGRWAVPLNREDDDVCGIDGCM